MENELEKLKVAIFQEAIAISRAKKHTVGEKNDLYITIEELNDLLMNTCAYECGFHEKYGFVPEAGCPIHDPEKELENTPLNLSMKKVAMEFTKEKKKHLDSLRWLYMGPRASGRTTLLAYVLIETVLKTKVSQRITDHFGNVQSDMYLARVIERLIEEGNLPLYVNKSRIVLELKK